VKLGYILGQKLEDMRSKSFTVSISVPAKVIRNKKTELELENIP